MVEPAGLRRVAILRSNPVAPDPRVEKIARALSDAGHQVVILGWDRTGVLPRQETEPYGIVHRLAIPAEFGRGIQNLPKLIRFELGLLGWLLRHRKTLDILHACDFDTVLPALLLRWFWGKVVVYDIFDFYAEMLRATPEFFKRLVRSVDLWAINQVDALILADQARRQQVKRSKPRRLSIVYNTPEDVRSTLPKDGASVGATGSFRLAFVGLLQVERGLLELLEVVAEHPEWTLDLAGFGGDEAVILAKAEKLSNVRVYGRVSYDVALSLTDQADALIATYDPSIPNHRYASPNKLFEAMMLGKPIVVAARTNMDRIVEDAGCGLVVPYGDVKALARALENLAADVTLRQSLGEAGRKAYETRFGWDLMRRRILDLYAQLG